MKNGGPLGSSPDRLSGRKLGRIPRGNQVAPSTRIYGQVTNAHDNVLSVLSAMRSWATVLGVFGVLMIELIYLA